MPELRSGKKRQSGDAKRAGAPLRAGKSSSGQEAIRASALVTLRPGDLVCDLSGSDAGRTSSASESLLWLDPPNDAESGSVLILLGAALALQAQSRLGAGRAATRSAALLLILLPAGNRRGPKWEGALQFALSQALPVVIISLPSENRDERGVRLRSRTPGPPVIPVDAADAVALCRVLEESCLRARSGDGPALIQTVHWRLSPGRQDPLRKHLRLLQRRGLKRDHNETHD